MWMKESSILVIIVVRNLLNRVVFRDIFSLYMKVSSILVISVIIKLQYREVFRDIFSLYMKVLSILVVSVIIKLHDRVISRLTYQQSTVTQFISVSTVTFKPSGELATALTSDLTCQLIQFD